MNITSDHPWTQVTVTPAREARQKDQWKFLLAKNGLGPVERAALFFVARGFIRVHNRSPKRMARVKHSLTILGGLGD